MKVGSIVLIANFSAVSLAVAVDTATPNAEQLEFFENKVRPLLADKCYRCHSTKAEEKGKLKAGLFLDSRAGLLKGGDSGSALTPGDPSKSFLVEAVNYRNEDMEMSSKPESLAQVTGSRDSAQSRSKRRRCAGKIATPVLVGFP